MKKIVKTFMVSATLVAALLVAVAAQAKDATLTGATGTVESLGKGGTWQKVSVSKSVKVGSTLRTGSTARFQSCTGPRQPYRRPHRGRYFHFHRTAGGVETERDSERRRIYREKGRVAATPVTKRTSRRFPSAPP